MRHGERPDFIYGDALEQGAGNRLLIKRARSHHFKWYGMFTHHQAMVYRRAVVEGQWFDLAWKIGADYAFTLDTLSKSVRVRTRRCSACTVSRAVDALKRRRRWAGGIRRKFAATVSTCPLFPAF